MLILIKREREIGSYWLLIQLQLFSVYSYLYIKCISYAVLFLSSSTLFLSLTHTYTWSYSHAIIDY